jgi:hypothetical protein
MYSDRIASLLFWIMNVSDNPQVSDEHHIQAAKTIEVKTFRLEDTIPI